MSKPHPTVLLYGFPDDHAGLLQRLTEMEIGLVIDNGKAKDPIFTIYENWARADIIICCPNAHPVHPISLITEGEVDFPLLLQEEIDLTKGARDKHDRKPIIFFGTEEQWQPFKDQFNGMREAGTLRPEFDRVVHYASTYQELLDIIEEKLVPIVDSSRTRYWQRTKIPADVEFHSREKEKSTAETIEQELTADQFAKQQAREKEIIDSNFTVSFLCSATTTQEPLLNRSRESGRMCGKNNWVVLHGGGGEGCMRELSIGAEEKDGYVIGVSVHRHGAPGIFFEKSSGDDVLGRHHEFIDSKDMLHRIETYCLNSEVCVAGDGGVGTYMELIIIAELLSQKHPAVMNITESGERVPMQLYVQNEGGLYDDVLKHLVASGYDELVDQMIVVNSTRELEQGIQAYQREHGPFLPKDRENLRNHIYQREDAIPKHDMTLTLPDLMDDARALYPNDGRDYERPVNPGLQP